MSRIRLFAASLVAACLLGVLVVAPPAPADPGGVPHVPGEVIIKWKDNATQADKDQIKAEMHATRIKGWARFKSELNEISGLTVDEAVARYKHHPKIEYIEPNYILYADAIPNDPLFPQLYGLNNTGQTGGTPDADIDAAEAWEVTTGSNDVIIGVIDTGIDYTHPDLAANAWTNPGEIPGNGIDDDGNGFIDDIHGWDFANDDNDPMDDHSHGSHCSGTIGGVGNNGIGVTGVNWHVKIMGLKFLSSGGSGSTSDAVDALNYAVMMGVTLTSNSWGGGGYSQALYDAIAAAGAANQLFVCAAGNAGSNTDVSPQYPSCYDLPNIVSVAATDHNDQLASFSNYGATTVDLGAPGVDIVSTVPGNSYASYSGTSMATPHVAGALGLIYARFPAIGALDAKNLIMNFADPIPALTGKCITGARLNAFFPIAEPDSIAPGAITDLATTTAGSNWLTLAWTAPGDDDDTGTASAYTVKFSTSPITEANWAAATTAPDSPDPGPAGTPETMVVNGLDFTTTYYFAVKARDEFGNTAPISNIASGTTLGAPDIDVTPTSLTETLLTGGTSTQVLTVSNLAQGTLDFTVPVPDLVTLPASPIVYVEYAKGVDDPNPGILGTGGPDGFGYRWKDSDEPFGPAFVWDDISGTGTVAISSGDDTNAGPFAIGFTFPYYGVDYTQFRVCSNGWLSFTSTSTAYGNSSLPSTGAPANMLAPFWDDLNVASGGTVYYYNDGSRLIVQWNDVPHYGSGGPYSFQAVIYPDGAIEYYYNTLNDPLNSATVGIQDATGTDGLTVAYNAAYLHDSMAIKIQAVPQWLTVAPTSGTVWNGASTTLNANFETEGLLGGDYDAFIRILSNDPDEPVVSVPVTLTVIGAPDVDLAPLSFDFGNVFLGATPTTSVLVSNPGTDMLHVSNVSIDDPTYAPDMTAFDVPPKGSVEVTVTFAPVAVGTYPATFTVTSDDPDEPTISMTLNGAGVVPPDFSVTPTELSAALFTGQAETRMLTLTNSGGANLEYTVAVDLGTTTAVYDMPDLGKGEIDVNEGILGTGGPDTFGYSWIDSDEPGGPAFDWVEISGVGTPMYTGNSDDGNMGPYPIGFNFPFYGNTFSTFRVCANGWISFTSSSTDYSNGALPGTGDPENLLAVYHDDMYVDADIPSQVYYYNDGTRLIVEYDNIRKLSQSDTAPPFYKFQAILYPNGTIVYQYLTVGVVNNSATVGIQNATRDDGLTVAYNVAYVHDNMAIRFASSPDWLSASPASGTIPPGGSEQINVTFNATDLFGGLYQGAVMIGTNDPLAPEVSVPCDLTVTGAPNIVIDPTGIDFGIVYVGYPQGRQYSVFNSGTDVLTITGFSSDNPAFVPDMTGVSLPIHLAPLTSTILRARFAPPAAGMYSGNLSIFSNDPDTPTGLIALSGEGLVAPVGGVSPTSLHADLLTGETDTRQVTLTNTGGSDLAWDATVLIETVAAVKPDIEPLGYELPKGEEDPRVGVLGNGGPDTFGYRWRDSDEPGGPVFDWVDISGVGTAVYSANADDSNLGPFPIGFDFSFYGNTFSTFRVCSNGFISFTSSSTDLSNDVLPGTGAPENLLALYHDDMYVDLSLPGQVYYYNDGTRLIVQYDNVRRYGQTSGPYYTMEAILYPTGTIVYQYLEVGTTNNSATIGIQNAAQDDGLMMTFNAEYAHPGLAVRIGALPEWLAASPLSGVIPAGGSQTVDVDFDASGMFGGDYNGAVVFATNDPIHEMLTVDATLHVTGVPRLCVSDASLDFGTPYVGYPVTLPLTVTNCGTDHLSVSSIMPGSADWSVDTATLELDPLQSAAINVTFDPQGDGDRGSMLTFMSNDPDSPHMVALVGSALYPPVVGLSPDPIVGAAKPGGSKTKTLTVCNSGGSDLVFTASASEHAASSTVTASEWLELPKQADAAGSTPPVDPRPGLLGTGGPDMFGYTWIDSDEPGGPAYDWVDISGVGTPVPFASYSDDGNSGAFPIGFDFPFYGNSFSDIRACTNGWLSFTSSLTAYTNQPLPNSGSAVPENLLAVFWDDMVFDSTYGAEAFYYYDGTRTIIQFNNIRRIATYTAPFYSYEVILYPNGNIVYQYESLGTTTNSATVGIQNAAKDDGLTVAFNAAYVHTGLAVQFSAQPAWLSISPESGVVPAGECVEITVTMDAAALEAGDYFGTVTVASNDPATPTASSEVIFHVGTVDAAWFDVDPNTLNLTSNGRWITARVELPMEYDPHDIVIETVMLNDAVFADPEHFVIDGDVAQFKFDRSAVEAILTEGDSVEVCVCGEIRDTIYFVACDFIRVINPHVNTPHAGDIIGTGEPVLITWDDPQGWNVDFATLMYSADGGVTWSLIADDLHGNSYQWVTPAEPSQTALVRVYVTDHKGVMGYDTMDGTFIVGSAILGAELPTPNVFALHQNAPNPFLGATRIRFDLPEASAVSLKIYDVSGRVIRVLADRPYEPGSYEVSWDGQDNGGRSVAAGIYFYKIETDGFSAVRRMFLQK